MLIEIQKSVQSTVLGIFYFSGEIEICQPNRRNVHDDRENKTGMDNVHY